MEGTPRSGVEGSALQQLQAQNGPVRLIENGQLPAAQSVLDPVSSGQPAHSQQAQAQPTSGQPPASQQTAAQPAAVQQNSAAQPAGDEATPPGNSGATPILPPPKARSIKTPLQKELLEAAYLIKKFPEEDVRRALGERIGLTEQQVQVWFSHKRRKEKKDQEEAMARQMLEEKAQQQLAAGSSSAAAPTDTTAPVAMDIDSAGPAVPPATVTNGPNTGSARATPPVPAQPGSTPSVPAPASLQAPASQPQTSLGANAPATPVAQPAIPANPPALAGAQPAAVQPQQPDASGPAAVVRIANIPPPPPHRELTAQERADIPELIALARAQMPVPFREDGPHLVYEFDDPPIVHISEEGAVTYADEEAAPKRKRVDGDDEESARKRRASAGLKGSARTEAERAEKDRKRAEEKADRDRKKQELARTKEELRLRVLQEREEKKLQVQAEKDRRAQERKDKLSERRKEKEMLKALQAQEKQATRLRQRDGGTGPKDDLDLEWETLLAAQQEAGYASGTEGDGPKAHALPQRPEFPPPGLGFLPAFPPQLGDRLGGDLLFVWSFLHSFGDVLGVWPATVQQLLQALVDGERSRLLGELHIGMLRIVQADMEEAHATGAMQSGSAINFLDRAIVNCATVLEEAWAWGFDVDVWRAHVNPLTWPEVLRQMAIAWGLGAKRPKPKKEVKPKMGTDGEDLVADENGGLKLRLPPRFGIGTVKAAAWAVLAETGPEGLSISEIARRIQQSGLRDLRTSKTPEASVAGALSRDVIFARTAPATYALQAILTYHNKLVNPESAAGDGKQAAGLETGKPEPSPSGPGTAERAGGAAKGSQTVKGEAGPAQAVKAEGSVQAKAEPGSGQPGAPAVKQEPVQEKQSEEREGEEDDDHEGDSSGDEDDEEEHEETEQAGEGWVRSLQAQEYSELSLGERLTILAALTHLVIEGPTLRNTLEARLEEAGRVRKQMWEEARLEKKRRQAEAAAKAKSAADEAQRVMDLFRSKEGSMAPSEAAAEGGGLEGTPAGSHPPASSKKPEGSSPEGAAAALQAPASKPAAAAPSARSTPDPAGRAAEPTPSREPSAEPSANPASGSAPGTVGNASTQKKAEGGCLERAASGAPPSEAGQSRKGDGEDDVSAAVAAKQRQLHRAETIRRAEEANAIRGEPLGLDRRHNRYWRFADAQNCTGDPFAGRLVIESHIDGSFRMLGSPEGVEGLVAALDKRGAREGPLYNALLRYRDALAEAMPTSTMPMLEARDKDGEEGLLEDQLAWLQGISSFAARRAKGKHPQPQHEDPRLEKLQRDLLLVEKALPREALPGDWEAAAWKEKVRSSGDAAALREALGTLEAAIKDGWLSPLFKRAPLLVKGAWLPTGNEVASALPGSNGEVQQLPQRASEAAVAPAAEPAPLAWLPTTLAAVALRLQALDAAAIYADCSQPARDTLLVYRYTQRPAALPKQRAEEARTGATIRKCSTLCGQPVSASGRHRPTLTPPFPLAFVSGERQAFSLDWDKLRKEIADEKAGIIVPPSAPIRSSAANADKKGAKKGSKANGKGQLKGAKAKASKSKKSRQSALREEFDRQSEEEEAAERRGFSTPGLSDDGSDFEEEQQPKGRNRTVVEDMEISE